MKIYEKPMAIVNKFEVADVIAASSIDETQAASYLQTADTGLIDSTTQGVVFQW